ncbi:MAG: restriction endonuclease subunit S [Candidatus Jacksonbacteria bacterium]|jgi:type I restriction enzyme, S subunit|nr:restriction endonuclease subunit S [Candidatus Jacksonbacteria bacterium]
MSAVKAEHYAAYTDSGVEWLGEVPKHWSFVRVKEIAYINQKSLSDETPLDYEFDYVDIGSVTYGTSGYSSERMTFENAPSRAKRIVKSGDTIISTVRTYLKAITQIDCAENLIVSTGFAVLTPKKIIYKSYFSNWLMSETFINRVSAISKGVSYPATNSTEIGDLFVFLPPLLEQTSIAAYLDTKTAQIDRQIDLLSQKATQYGKLKQSLINETVTRGLDKSVPMKDSGVEWIGEVPENWDIRRIKEIFIESKSKSLKGNEDLLSVSEYTGVTLKQDNVGEDEFLTNAASLIGYKLCKIGDLVINIMLAWKRGLGVSAYYGIASPSYAVYTPQKEINSSFFHYRLRNEDAIAEFKRNSTGIIESRLRLYSDSFYALSIAVPPLDEQTAIAAYLDEKSEKIDRIIDTINTQIYKLKDLRKALINDVVTGKIKVGSEGQTI